MASLSCKVSQSGAICAGVNKFPIFCSCSSSPKGPKGQTKKAVTTKIKKTKNHISKNMKFVILFTMTKNLHLENTQKHPQIPQKYPKTMKCFCVFNLGNFTPDRIFYAGGVKYQVWYSATNLPNILGLICKPNFGRKKFRLKSPPWPNLSHNLKTFVYSYQTCKYSYQSCKYFDQSCKYSDQSCRYSDQICK